MKLYGGMDLHSTNVVTKLIDEKDKVIYRNKHGCDGCIKCHTRCVIID